MPDMKNKEKGQGKGPKEGKLNGEYDENALAGTTGYIKRVYKKWTFTQHTKNK